MVTLRGYQKKAINSALSLLNSGKSRVIICSPPGSGKSIMALEITRRVTAANCSTLIISHRREILDQLRKLTGCKCVSIQSLISRAPSEEQEALSGTHSINYHLVIIDEAHHYKAEEWSLIFELFPDSLFLGLTATPPPGLGSHFEEIVIAANYPELVRKGHLSKCKIIRPKGGFCGPDLAFDPVDAYKRYANSQRAFLFAPSREASRFYAQKFSDAGIPAAHVDGATSAQDREQALELFRKWDIDVICNVQIMTEGVNVPEASCCILAGNSSNLVSYLQKTGRVLRTHESKSWATLLDLVGSSWVYGSPIDARDFSLTEGVTLSKDKGFRDCPQCCWGGRPVAICPECGWDFLEQNRIKKGIAKIHSQELEEVWAGKQTPKADKEKEWTFLKSRIKEKGFSLYRVCSEYSRLFAEPPPLTEQEKMDLYFGIAYSVLRRNHKLGAAWHRYKNLMKEKPDPEWVRAVKEHKRKWKQIRLL